MSDKDMINIFDCVSPLDFRYYGQDEQLRELLGPYLTERARVASELRVEVAAVQALANLGVCEQQVADEVRKAVDQVTPEAVAAEERRIHHNIRALVNCLRRQVSPSSRPYIHLCLTSFDVIDTALAWRFKNVSNEVVVPQLLQLEQILIDLARREKDTLQIGRTHGQHAEPITFGFAMAEYVGRLGERIEAITSTGNNLRGKVSGAVGAYNASGLFFDDPQEFEREVLNQLDLEPATHSTQIIPPEFVCDFIHSLISTFGVLANLADDMRNLQRSEIAEVAEAFEAQQVGSSTMPHKRNPWNFENVKSMWKAFVPRMLSVYADQISDHQRDLTNSASSRFLPEIIVALLATVKRLRKIMGRLVTDAESMRRNFQMTEDLIAAEPAYILLAAAGHPDAHEVIRKLTLQAQQSGRAFCELLEEDEEIRPHLERFTEAQRELLRSPAKYIGVAAAKAEQVCGEWERRLALAG